MDTLVEILATLVVIMATAALSLFGVKMDASSTTAAKPPVISRTSSAAPMHDRQEAAKAMPVQPMAADCPLRKASATKADKA